MPTRPIPEGYHTVTPYLLVKDAATVVDFLIEAFGATESLRLRRADGTVMHCEVHIGDSVVMIGEPTDAFGPLPGSIYVYVADCDAVYQRAVQAGATTVMEPADMVHTGERCGGVKDPAGNVWWIATHVEDVSPEEQARRIAAMDSAGE